MMGLEEHLIGMFRHDFEFTDGHQSHLGHLGGHSTEKETKAPSFYQEKVQSSRPEHFPHWTPEGESELAKIPFFVRGKVRKNTEKYANQIGCKEIDGETLLDAKAHFNA